MLGVIQPKSPRAKLSTVQTAFSPTMQPRCSGETVCLVRRSEGEQRKGTVRLPLREEVPEADPSTSLAINALRLTLHPKGLASRVLNLAQWRENLLSRLRREWEAGRDPVLAELYSVL